MNKTGIAATTIAFAALMIAAIALGGRPSTIHPPQPAPRITHTAVIITSPLPTPSKSIITTPKPIAAPVKAAHKVAGPSAADYAELRAARAASGMICHLEFDGPGMGYEAICTPPRVCKGVPDDLMNDCITLYHRKAESHTNADGSKISNPAGPALVRECTSQYHDHAELKPCLTQPHI